MSGTVNQFSVWVGLTEHMGYGKPKEEPLVRLAITSGSPPITEVFTLSLDAAQKVARRIDAYVKAGRTV